MRSKTTDKPVLLDSIRSRFAKNQSAQSDTENSDPLGNFNRKVRDLLGEQIMSSSGRILQYSMTVSAFVLRWAGQDVLNGSLPDTAVPLLDYTLFVGPIPLRNLSIGQNQRLMIHGPFFVGRVLVELVHHDSIHHSCSLPSLVLGADADHQSSFSMVESLLIMRALKSLFRMMCIRL